MRKIVKNIEKNKINAIMMWLEHSLVISSIRVSIHYKNIKICHLFTREENNLEKEKQKSPASLSPKYIIFCLFLLFSVLIIQLGVVQILNGETYQEEIDRKSTRLNSSH